jgi:myo-inositol-1(or 4)-monophosphatase
LPAPEAAPGPDPAARDDLALLVAAARDAGEIAMGHWRQAPEVWEKEGDEGPVTEADYAVDAALRRALQGARPDYGWMSEETPDTAADRARRTLFIVDPIDGTRAFVKGEEAWAHALAVVTDGVPVAAVVYLPAMGRLYAAAAGAGATRNGAPLAAAAPPALDAAQMLVTRPNLAPHLWRGGVPGLTRHFRPSLAYRLALVAEGRFDGMLTLRDSWDWDVAAGALIAAEAGVRVTDRTGAPLRFNAAGRKTAGVLAAPEPLHGETLSRLAPGARVD